MESPTFVPSECLVYLVRVRRAEQESREFRRLYEKLAARVLSRLPRAEGHGGISESLTQSNIRDQALYRFCELLAEDRKEYSALLDYYEVNFNHAVAALRMDAEKKYWTEENRSEPLQSEEESDVAPVEEEQALKDYDPFSFEDYRSEWDVAIKELKPIQRQIVEMLRLGFNIESKDPDEMTISKALGKAEKTIRNQRDKAYVALRAKIQNPWKKP